VFGARGLREEEKQVQARLKENLDNFSKLSGAKTYVQLLNQQKAYIDQLREQLLAEEPDNKDMLRNLDNQLNQIDSLKKATLSASK